MRNFEGCFIILSCILSFSTLSVAQTSCETLSRQLKLQAKQITTDRSYFDDVISKISFYKQNKGGEWLFYALVTFKSNTDKEYIYQIPKKAMDDYLSWSGIFKDDTEKFWKYIQPYNKVLNCTPRKRQGNKYEPKY